MSRSSNSRPPRFDLRWIWSSPLVFAGLAMGMVATVVFERALGAMYEADSIRGRLVGVAARIAAEEAAREYVLSSGSECSRAVEAGVGVPVRTAIMASPNGRHLHLQAQVGERLFDYLFERLPGGTSPVFGRPFTAGCAEVPPQWTRPTVVQVDQLPRVRCSDPAGSGKLSSDVLEADAGIALLRLSAGTDRDDYVLHVAEPRLLEPPPGGVAFVRGNLWIDRGDAPMVLNLNRNLTLIVHGNVYLGRGVRVQGDGLLTIVTVVHDGTPFADLDGNGRWSEGDQLSAGDVFRGPMEGSGAIYLGLPMDSSGVLEFDLGLVAGGVLHVAAQQAIVHGPVVLHGGGAVLPNRAGRLVTTGTRLPRLERTALPGFLTVGRPRPGPLQQLPREPLYPARAPR